MDQRRTIARLLLIVPLLAAGIGLGRAAPAAAATSCATTITGGTIKDSLVVPAGATCLLRGVTVRGGVTVLAAGALSAINSEIRGAVVATDASGGVGLTSTVVRGPVTVTGWGNGLSVQGAEIRGDLTITGGSGPFLVSITTIRGTATFLDNDPLGPNSRITSNSIDADLICEGNDLTLQVIVNVVGGIATGDCAGNVEP